MKFSGRPRRFHLEHGFANLLAGKGDCPSAVRFVLELPGQQDEEWLPGGLPKWEGGFVAGQRFDLDQPWRTDLVEHMQPFDRLGTESQKILT